MARVHDHAGQFPPENLDWQALIPPMPSATDFFSTAKKSRQKMPLSNAEGLAQRKSLL